MPGRRRKPPTQDPEMVTSRLEVVTSRFPSRGARGDWLFEFLRVDFENLTPGQLLDLRMQAWAFMDPPEGAIVELDADLDDDRYPALSALRELQDTLRNGITMLQQGETWSLEQPITYGIVRVGNDIIRSHRQASFTALFGAAMLDAVQDAWPRLRECPRCGALFYKVGKRTYCSPACSRKTRWDTFKSKRGQRDNRTERAGAVKTRLGPKSKVKAGRRRPSTKRG